MLASLWHQIMTPGCGTAVAVAAGGHLLVDALAYGGFFLAGGILGRKFNRRKCGHHHGNNG